MTQKSTSASFFEDKYRRTADPWNFEHSRYEQERYGRILTAIRGQRYTRAFEPGCSIGILTQRLCDICDQVEAIDISATAVASAKQRCKNLRQIRIRCCSLADAVLEGTFDLIVFSEIGYYFEEDGLRKILDHLIGSLSQTGIFVAAHWLGRSKDHVLNGDAVHEIVRDHGSLLLDHEERRAHFRLDRLVRI